MLALSMILAACGGKDSGSGAKNDSGPVAEGDLKEKELVKLNVVMMRNNKKDTVEVVEAVNQITREKLNVEMDLTYIKNDPVTDRFFITIC
ncbi:hypothetical protein [Paenibacillus lactis]|uniref:hypothetical protein n=1 Tax=Paenibacillus lactis TaxID=228574 RepID=UPI001BCB9044|nr:hypothetical protein [Paenibacillus lactis]